MSIQLNWYKRKVKWATFWLLLLVLVACGRDRGGEIETEAAVQPDPLAQIEADPTPTNPAPAVDDQQTAANEAVEAIVETETAVNPTPTTMAEPEPETTAAAVTLRIDPARSEARFIIDEILRGNPFTVIGVTSDLTGDLSLNLHDPAQTEVGEITVDARTLVTDDNMRNRAIANFILNTSLFQFVSFTPTNLVGLPTTVAPGQTVEFQIEGELTIRDITQPVMFDAIVNIVSATEINGQASTTIQRDDFNLSIPRVPQVASVAESLTLEIEFVATADLE
jgi:polyisoprenoid-binding protein YceI